MKPPTTYADWVSALDAFQAGAQDDEVLSTMEHGSLSWSSGVAERFVARLTETCNARLNRLNESQRRVMGRATGEREVVQCLLTARREFARLHRLTSLPVLPEGTRSSLQAMVRDCARQAQEGLERSAQQDRTGRLTHIVRSTSVEAYGA